MCRKVNEVTNMLQYFENIFDISGSAYILKAWPDVWCKKCLWAYWSLAVPSILVGTRQDHIADPAESPRLNVDR